MLQELNELEQQHGLPKGLLYAVMQAESSGNPKAVSEKGAQGLFQFMPETAESYGIDPKDPKQAAIGAAKMYADLQKQYDGDLDKMLMGYNWGSGNLAKHGAEKAPKETIDYIAKVKAAMPQQYDDASINNVYVGLTLEQQQALAIAEAETQMETEQLQDKESVSPNINNSVARTIIDQSLQGLPLVGTFTDEVTSALGGLGGGAYLGYRNVAPEFLGGFPAGQEIDFDLEDLMGEANKSGNERIALQLEDNPGTAILSQLASGLLTGGAAIKSAGLAPSLFKGSKNVADKAAKVYNWAGRGNALQRAGKIAGTGVPASYLYGLGDDSGEGRIENAEDSAIFGAIPAALPLVGASYRGGKKLVKAIPNAASATASAARSAKNTVLPPPAPVNAQEKILQRLDDDSMTLEGLEARLARTPGSALIDVGRGNLERLAEASSNLPGKSANDAVKFVSRRLSSEPRNIKNAINDYIAGGDFNSTAERIMKDAEEKVQPLYKEVYSANPSIQSKKVDRILQTPAGKTALKNAAELMLNDRKLLGYTDPELLEQAKLAGQEIEGGVASGLKMQTLDYVKRALDDMWNKADYGSNERRILNNLRKDMVSALDEADASGKYKEARSIWAGAMSGQEAMEEGRNILKADQNDVKKYFSSLGETEKELYKLGVAQNLKDVISSAPDRTNMARKIFGRDEYRENLRAVLGREQFNKLRASLMRQEKQHLLNQRLLGNSRTALRAAEMEDLKMMDPESAAALLSGNPMSFMLRSLKNQIAARAQGLNRDTASNVTSILFETDPEKQKKIISQLKETKAAKKSSPLMSLKSSKQKVTVP